MKLTKGQEAETEILKLWIFLTDEHNVSVCILCVHVGAEVEQNQGKTQKCPKRGKKNPFVHI